MFQKLLKKTADCYTCEKEVRADIAVLSAEKPI